MIENAARLLEQTLHREIPITAAMGITVTVYDGRRLGLSAPLAPNANHVHTAFAGSLNAVTTLAGWGLLYLLLMERALKAQVVIQDGTIAYSRPVTRDFTALCERPDERVLERFMVTLERHGRGRIRLGATIIEDGATAVTFAGTYVAHAV